MPVPGLPPTSIPPPHIPPVDYSIPPPGLPPPHGVPPPGQSLLFNHISASSLTTSLPVAQCHWPFDRQHWVRFTYLPHCSLFTLIRNHFYVTSVDYSWVCLMFAWPRCHFAACQRLKFSTYIYIFKERKKRKIPRQRNFLWHSCWSRKVIILLQRKLNTVISYWKSLVWAHCCWWWRRMLTCKILATFMAEHPHAHKIGKVCSPVLLFCHMQLDKLLGDVQVKVCLDKVLDSTSVVTKLWMESFLCCCAHSPHLPELQFLFSTGMGIPPPGFPPVPEPFDRKFSQFVSSSHQVKLA